ncbi:MAG: ABC transporter substrate-binding protein, partial [Clostridiales bacterium]|nr:ABC transporter substrate-binding protein [Clostridiales bacterium]
MEITAFFLRRLGFQRINFRRINSKLHSFKVFSLVSLLILGLFLTACSANKDEKVTDEGENQVIANTEDTEENPSEEATEEETAEAETVKTETAEHKWRTLKSIAEGTYDTEHSTSKTTDETEEPENFTQKNTTEPSGDLEEVRIGYPSSGQNFPVGLLGVADYKGYLDEYLVPLGYKSVPLGFVGNAPAINEALVAEELDFVVYTGMAGVLSRANGIEHTLLSITSWGNGGGWKIIAGTDSGIESIADLKGKKIAYTRGASPHMYLIRVLEEAGVAFEEIEPLNMNPTEGAAGVASGSVDATVVFAGFEAELVKNGIAKVIHSQFKADEDVYYEPTLFIARTAYYNEHRDVAIAIQKEIGRAH